MKLEDILKMSQSKLKTKLVPILKKMGYEKVFYPKGFVYAPGSIPVLLIAHLDTVHKKLVKIICYSQDNQIIMSPEGIGGDDRAGVYMILEIIKEKKCHVLFCLDEEKGGIGAKLFSKSRHKPEVNYILEFDRRGGNDAVFYDCDNKEFTDFICSFGFEKECGSFSDISVIAPALGIAAVNLSAGYYNEHTRYEYINLAEINNNIKRAKEIISSKTDMFEYIEKTYLTRVYNFRGYLPEDFEDIQDKYDLWEELGYDESGYLNYLEDYFYDGGI